MLQHDKSGRSALHLLIYTEYWEHWVDYWHDAV